MQIHHGSAFPTSTHLLRVGGDDLPIRRDPLPMESRLRQPALPQVQRRFAGEQSLTQYQLCSLHH